MNISKLTFLSGGFRLRRGLMFGILIVGALLAFETFNYSTTDFAMTDLLGDLSFMGVRWATILAIAFCGIDFAGIARLFTPEQGSNAHKEVWYLFGAWMLAATMNAMLTWWGVSIAIVNHQTLGNAVVNREILLRSVPIFVAIMVWLIRILIIGTLSVSGNRIFNQADRPIVNAARPSAPRKRAPSPRPSLVNRKPAPASARSGNQVPTYRPAQKPQPQTDMGYVSKPEPTYHPVSMRSKSRREQQTRF